MCKIRKFLEWLGIGGALAFGTAAIIAGVAAMVTALTTLASWVQRLAPTPQMVFYAGAAATTVGLTILLNRAIRVTYGFASTKVPWIPRTKAITEEMERLTHELAQAKEMPSRRSISTAAERVGLTFLDLVPMFGVQRQLVFRFQVTNWSLAGVEFSEAVDGSLATGIDGPVLGAGRIDGPRLNPLDRGILQLHWDMTESLAKTLAYYAGKDDGFTFDLSNISFSFTCTAGALRRTFSRPIGERITVKIRDHAGFQRIRETDAR